MRFKLLLIDEGMPCSALTRKSAASGVMLPSTELGAGPSPVTILTTLSAASASFRTSDGEAGRAPFLVEGFRFGTGGETLPLLPRLSASLAGIDSPKRDSCSPSCSIGVVGATSDAAVVSEAAAAFGDAPRPLTPNISSCSSGTAASSLLILDFAA